MTNEEKKKIWRIANWYHERVVAGMRDRRICCATRLLDCTPYQPISGLSVETLTVADAEQFIKNYNWEMDRTTRELDRALAELGECQIFVTVKDVYNDLLIFLRDGGEIDYTSKALVKTTKPVVLQDIPLGAFTVVFPMATADMTADALDPNPAKGSGGRVTHPHVKDGGICLGEGAAAFYTAARGGQILDVFDVAFSVLYNYSNDSPFILLEDWDNESCSNCGYGHENYTCSGCDAQVCEECSMYCNACDRTVCEGCQVGCAYCGHTGCGSCMYYCAKCEKPMCSDCTSRCERCDEMHCERHISTCISCSESVCAGCSEKCSECGDSVCDNCKRACDLCGEDSTKCSNCAEPCIKCDEPTCENCRTTCEKCGETSCAKCFENYGCYSGKCLAAEGLFVKETTKESVETNV